MPTQSYGGRGLFGQPSFGDYSKLSGGVPEPMTQEEIQYQLSKQRLQDYENLYANKYESPESSAFNTNVNTRQGYSGGVPMNPYIYPMPFSSVSDAVNMSQQQATPVSLMTTVNPMDVRDDQVDTSSNVATSQGAALPVNTGYSSPRLVSDSPIVSGVFPEVDAMQRALYQQKQNEAMQAQAMQYAQLDPMARAQYSLYLGGQQLGGAIGGALGAKDPQLQMIGLQQQILRELDPSNPNQQLQVAQKYAQVAPDLAMKIADNARSSLVKIAQANKERQASVAPDVQKAERAASITQAISQYKALPQTPEIAQAIQTLQAQLDFLKPKAEATPNEIQLAQAFAGEKGVKGTPEYNAEYVSQLLRLTDQKENIIDVGVADKTRKVVYFDKKSDQQFTMEPDSTGKLVRTPYSGGIDKTTAKVTATASQKGETAFSEQLGKIDAKQVEDAMGLRNNAISALGTLERLNKLDEQGLISGSFATGRVGAANILATIGLISEKDQGILAASQNYQKTSGDLVLATLGGKLGSGFSNDDRKFIVGLVPQLETNALARKQLIEFMVKKNRDIITETTRLDDYARENKSLKGFVPKIPIFNVSSGESKSVNQMSRQELINAIEAKKREAAQ